MMVCWQAVKIRRMAFAMAKQKQRMPTPIIITILMVVISLLCMHMVHGYPSFSGQYSVTLYTRDYDYDNYCSEDTHTEYISTPNYATVAYPGNSGQATLYRYDLSRTYKFPFIAKTPCTTSVTSSADMASRYDYLGDWLDSASVSAGTTTINGVTTTGWASDESWLDFTYLLYVTSAGLPVREFGCSQSDDEGYYAYVTDFTGYTVGTPNATLYFKVPSSCPSTASSNPFVRQSTRDDEPPASVIKTNLRRARRFHRTIGDYNKNINIDTGNGNGNGNGMSKNGNEWRSQAGCSEFSYSSICATLIARQEASSSSSSSSSSTAAIVGGVIGGIFGCICCVFCCIAICRSCDSGSPQAERTWVQTTTASTDPTPVPMVTFHYEKDDKEEKRPDGPQLTREKMLPRDEWRARCAAIDFTYACHDDGRPYWDESGMYRLTGFACREIERATRELHARCMDAVARVISSDELLLKFGISPVLFPIIRQSWQDQLPSIYGRFDLMYDGRSPPKLLEYNADTPTLLVESGIAQRTWLADMKARGSLPSTAGQFNELEASLAEMWRITRQDSRVQNGNDTMYFACLNHHNEDEKNMEAMRRHANDAGFVTKSIHMEDIVWNGSRFVDRQGLNIDHCWKLYPLEWMAADALPHLASSSTQWLEPPWKIILSSKGILPLLWEMFPNHPNLVPATWDEATAKSWGTRYVSKPLQGREGQLTTVHESNGSPVYQRGVRADDPDGVHGLGARLVYQQFVSPPVMLGQLPPVLPAVANAIAVSAPGGPQPTAPPPPFTEEKSIGTAIVIPTVAATIASPSANSNDPPPPYDASAAIGGTTGIAPNNITISVAPAAAVAMAAGVAAPAPPAAAAASKFDHPLWPVFGSWVVGGQPAGIVIREDIQLITNNESRIIPHYVEAEFKTTPPAEIPQELREEVPATVVAGAPTSSTTVIYSGYRSGYAYRRSTYWYPMSFTQAHYYRVHRPIIRPIVIAPPPHHFGGFSGGGGYGGGHSSWGGGSHFGGGG